jgi:hypothetical protein
MTNEESEREAQRLASLTKAGNKIQVIRHLAEANEAIKNAIIQSNKGITLKQFAILNDIQQHIEELALNLLNY